MFPVCKQSQRQRGRAAITSLTLGPALRDRSAHAWYFRYQVGVVIAGSARMCFLHMLVHMSIKNITVVFYIWFIYLSLHYIYSVVSPFILTADFSTFSVMKWCFYKLSDPSCLSVPVCPEHGAGHRLLPQPPWHESQRVPHVVLLLVLLLVPVTEPRVGSATHGRDRRSEAALPRRQTPQGHQRTGGDGEDIRQSEWKPPWGLWSEQAVHV